MLINEPTNQRTHTPAVNDHRSSAVRTVHSDFPSEGQQRRGINQGSMVRPAGKVELFHNPTTSVLKAEYDYHGVLIIYDIDIHVQLGSKMVFV